MTAVWPCILLVLLVSCVAFVSTACNKDSGIEVNGVKIYDNIVTPSVYTNKVRGLIMPNGLQMLLVSDETTEMAAVSMSVWTGSIKDFVQYQGIAHYLEHVLFLGTESVNIFGFHYVQGNERIDLIPCFLSKVFRPKLLE